MEEQKKYRILVAEDNKVSTKVAEFILKPIASVLDFAANGEEVINKVGLFQYDVILMDVKMPVMDGYEATRKIRQIEKENNVQNPIRIIATTANNQPEEVEFCKKAGMNDLIVKPFTTSDIMAVVS